MASLTVKDLRALLSCAPEDMEVWVEGCDCVGELSGASIMTERLENAPPSDYLLLRREDGVYKKMGAPERRAETVRDL